MNHIEKLKSLISEFYKNRSEVAGVLHNHKAAIMAMQKKIDAQENQIEELREFISELFYKVNFAESEEVNYSELWLKSHTGHPSVLKKESLK